MKKILFSLFVLVSISALGQIGQSNTYTGSTTEGSQDGGLFQARYSYPTCVIKAGFYTYVGDNGRLRKIDELGNVSTISTVIGNIHDMAYDATTNTFIVSTVIDYEKVLRIDTNGAILGQIYSNSSTTSSFGGAWGVEVDDAGNIYYSVPTFHAIQKYVPSTNTTTTYAGTPFSPGNANGTLLGSSFSYPRDLEFDTNGNLYFTDQNNTVIKKITATAVSTLTGSADNINCISYADNMLYFTNNYKLMGFNLLSNSLQVISGTSNTSGFQNGNAATSRFNGLMGIFPINSYYLLACDYYNHQIRRIQIGDACANATVLTNNSDRVLIGSYFGNPPSGSGLCYNYSNNNAAANWYKFTPTQNGVLTVTSQTVQNPISEDTRLSIYSGTCGSLTCVAGNDDISPGINKNSSVQNLEIVANTTYYIVWDNIHDSAAIDFTYTFTPQTCFTPNAYSLVSPVTTTSVHLQWNAPTLGDSTPDSYSVQIGLRNWGRQPAGLIQSGNPTTNSFQFTGLEQGKVYDMYVKSNCSVSDESLWEGPIQVATAFDPVEAPYVENFDTETSFGFLGLGRYSDTTNANWRFQTGGPNAFVYNGANSVYSISDSAALTNAYLFTKPVNLIAGQSYNVNFYLKDYSTSGNTTQYQVEVLVGTNTTSTTPADYNIIWTDFDTQASNVFVAKNASYTPSVSGAYRFAIRNSSQSTGTGTHYLFVDNLVISSTLSVEDFNQSGLSLYPNPVLDVITLQNTNNLTIKKFSVVDMNGRVLQTNTLSNDNSINLSALSKGIYFIQLDTEKGILSKKIIKE
ncbi:T9SS type A sorting domain-containing protein [Flavobacterium sp. GCM10023249]|uniref:T9SS type A sorting domain-containing protein n=1 Tax=unclassified Flavobacterium TaxID=196869 RepID=UPI0036070158